MINYNRTWKEIIYEKSSEKLIGSSYSFWAWKWNKNRKSIRQNGFFADKWMKKVIDESFLLFLSGFISNLTSFHFISLSVPFFKLFCFIFILLRSIFRSISVLIPFYFTFHIIFCSNFKLKLLNFILRVISCSGNLGFWHLKCLKMGKD